MPQTDTGTSPRAPITMPLAASLGAVLLAVWWSWVSYLEPVYALKGFSPIAWVYKSQDAVAFLRDFAGGTDNYGKSIFMHVYLLASAGGVSPEMTMPLVIAVEIVLLAWASWVLSRELAPHAPLLVPWIVAVLVVASPVRNMNLAFFPQPYFVGQYYNVADVLRIFGIVMVLRGQLLWAAVLLAGAFATHPILGLMGLAFAGAMYLAGPRKASRTQLIIAAGTYIALAGGWTLLQYRTATISGGQIPVARWIEMTRAFSFHWFSIENGLFAERGQYVLLPFMAFLLLIAYYWPRGGAESVTSRMVGAGIALMLALSVLGLAIAVFVPIPVLIKLALHRSNDLVIFVGLVYLVDGLWRDAGSARWWRWAVAATLLASLARAYALRDPALGPALPLLWSMLLALAITSPAWWKSLEKGSRSHGDWVVTVLALVVGALTAHYLYRGLATGVNPYQLFGGRRAQLYLLAFLAVGTLLWKRRSERHLRFYGVAALTILSVVGLKERADQKSTDLLAVGYLRAQLWARENTPSDALFMTDPTIYYGWRDFSRRSSFGNVREWLHTNWIYDSNVERYEEGLRRFSEFGVDLTPYLNAKLAGGLALRGEVRSRYYGMTDAWRLDMAKRYGIDYFVVERRFVVSQSLLPLVYENEHFSVFSAVRGP